MSPPRRRRLARGPTPGRPAAAARNAPARDGNVCTPWYSLDDKSWYRENAWTLASTGRDFPLRIGLFAQDNQNITDPGADAWFDYVHVYDMN